MTAKEIKLAAYFLELAASQFSNHGCNDVEDEAWEGWTTDERKKFIAEFYRMNNDNREADEGHIHLEDWCIMSLLAKKLKDM